VQYLGGKSRIAKPIAAIVNEVRGDRPFWEPFCGGLSVSVRLAKHGPGIVSDANPALIALYRGVRAGWTPPAHVSEPEWRAARTLPDTDPLKAFAGFGCSFGGKWFGGRARGLGRDGAERNYAAETNRSLARDIPALAGSAIECLDFLAIEPRPCGLGAIYCDPPYAGTTGYGAVGELDHARFWARAQGWARCGAPVLVSELACPVPARTVWAREHRRTIGGDSRATQLEQLFWVLP
jgi:DNA adenine methylase